MKTSLVCESDRNSLPKKVEIGDIRTLCALKTAIGRQVDGENRSTKEGANFDLKKQYHNALDEYDKALRIEVSAKKSVVILGQTFDLAY